MSKEYEPFRPELVDEQVDQLLQGNPTRSPESRLSHELQDHYTQDARSLAKVWARLERSSESGMEKSPGRMDKQSNDLQSAQRLRKPAFRQNRFRTGRAHSMQTDQIKAKYSNPIRPVLTASAAVLTAAVIVGSMLWALGVDRSTKTPQLKTTTANNVQATSSPAVYIGSTDGLVRADARTGKIIWRYQIPAASNPYGQVAFLQLLSAGKVVYGLKAGSGSTPTQVMAFHAKTGQILWSVESPEARSIVLGQGVLYIAADDPNPQAHKSYVSTLDANNGTSVSTKYTLAGSYLQLAFVDGVLYASTDQGLFAIDTAQGQIWHKSTAELGLSGPNYTQINFSVANGTIYGTMPIAQSIRCFALKASNGDLLWHADTSVTAGASGGGSGFTAPVVGDGLVYVATFGHTSVVYAYKAQNGTQAWQYKTSAVIQKTPVFSQDMLYITEDVISTETPRTYLTALKGATGTPAWKTSTKNGTGTSASVLNGIVYVATGYDRTANITYALNSSTGASIWQAKLGTDPSTLVATR